MVRRTAATALCERDLAKLLQHRLAGGDGEAPVVAMPCLVWLVSGDGVAQSGMREGELVLPRAG
jgi:hypothetical protein